MEQFAQTTVNILAWFLVPFAVVVVVDWITSLFRRD